MQCEAFAVHNYRYCYIPHLDLLIIVQQPCVCPAQPICEPVHLWPPASAGAPSKGYASVVCASRALLCCAPPTPHAPSATLGLQTSQPGCHGPAGMHHWHSLVMSSYDSQRLLTTRTHVPKNGAGLPVRHSWSQLVLMAPALTEVPAMWARCSKRSVHPSCPPSGDVWSE